MTEIETILAPLKAKGIEAGFEQCGPFWQVWIGGHGDSKEVAGAREDGISLARDLKTQYEYRKAREASASPEKQERSRDIPPPPQPDPRLDLQAARIAELEAALAAAAAPKPEPAGRVIAPPELADLIEMNETPPETHARLTRLYADAKQAAELARSYGGTFNGKSTVEWERKAERYDSGIKWNRGRMAETV